MHKIYKIVDIIYTQDNNNTSLFRRDQNLIGKYVVEPS